MILVEEKGERDPQLLVIRQTDHALLAGFLGREWGNERFTKPQPNASFCLAVAEHDNGWGEWELQAQLDPKTRLPFSFMSIPTAIHTAIYQKGIERLVKVDYYAGLLASMHASCLYDRARATMPGFSAKYVKSEESHIANEFVQQLRLQQLRLKVDLRSNPGTKPFMEEPLLNANVARLETLDRLSLHFCMNPDQDAVVDAVPVNDQGEDADLELRAEGANVVAVAPYPFRRDPLSFSIMARRVAKKTYSSDADFQKALAAAQYLPVKFTMRARKEGAFSRSAGI
ncbi:MAG TPA: DUF3891 family protein [Candidatus Acidoferrum sp.]|jgi:hypothetical protein